MNIPNLITLIRLILIPVFILVFFSSGDNHFIYAMLIFFIAGISDVLDGYIARKYNMITKWGTVLDPFADKSMLITVLSCLVIQNYLPFWVVIVIICKELFMVLSGIILFSKDTVIPSNSIGKISTFLFYLSIFILIFNNTLGTYMIYISVAMAIVSLLNYSLIFFKQKKFN